jgi:hypothetical protein
MTARVTVRMVAVGVVVAVMALATLQEVAGANDMPPPPAPAPHTVDSCISDYQHARAFVLSQFTESFLEAAQTKKGMDLGNEILRLLLATVGALQQSEQTAIQCAATATGGPSIYHAAALSAAARHGGGRGGGGTVAGCKTAFDAAVKKATRAEDRSFRKKHHKPTLQQATSTFDAAVQAAGQKLATCAQNANG